MIPEGAWFDALLALYNDDGQVIAVGDDAYIEWGAGGSVHEFDSFISYYFDQPGTYYVVVGSCCDYGNPVPLGTSYELQVSLENHPVGADEPERKRECKKGGWRDFENPDGSPMFKNRGDCVSFVASKGRNQQDG
jgi:hypothetical protein